MAPYGEEVVDILPPDKKLGVGISQKFVVLPCHKEVGIRRGHPCAHCCVVDLQRVLVSKNEIFLQDFGDQFSHVGSCWLLDIPGV